MTTAAAPMTDAVSPVPILLWQSKEPPTFHGSVLEDSKSWLEAYDRVAHFNTWTSEDKLCHVYFALKNATCTRFGNQERTLTTWDTMRTKFLATFTSINNKERAKRLLEDCLQLPNENLTLFAEKMTTSSTPTPRCLKTKQFASSCEE